MSALRRAVVCAPTRRRVLLEALFVCTKATQRECKSAGALHHVFRRTSLIKVPALFLVRSFESFHGLPGVAGSPCRNRGSHCTVPQPRPPLLSLCTGKYETWQVHWRAGHLLTCRSAAPQPAAPHCSVRTLECTRRPWSVPLECGSLCLPPGVWVMCQQYNNSEPCQRRRPEELQRCL